MIRLDLEIDLGYEIAGPPADFVFNIHAARTSRQSVVSEGVTIDPPRMHRIETDPASGNRYLRLRAGPGPLAVRYEATVDLDPRRDSPALLQEAPVDSLPENVLAFVYPSRYCQSDQLRAIASREFGTLSPGYGRVAAIADWVRNRTTFSPGSSNSGTCALETLTGRAGVCRDFAHLMIALCRALNIPARFVTSIDYGAPAVLGPPDFHAFVEAYLSGRWYAFDPTGIATPMGLVRIGTGRDAADVSFATLFGEVVSRIPVVAISALDDPANGFELPRECAHALCTSDEWPSREMAVAPVRLRSAQGNAKAPKGSLHLVTDHRPLA